MKKYKCLSALIFITLLVLAGCSSSTGNDPNRPRANAGPDTSAAPGEAVTLDGSLSTSDGDTLTYNWRITSMPAGSSATIADSTAVITTFTPDMNGTYVIRLTVTDSNGSSSDDVRITVSDGNEPEVVTSNITTERHLSNRFTDPSAVDYRIQGVITVTGNLIVAPGVRIEAAPGSRLVIAPGGRITAVGSESSPIHIRGASSAPGSWDGVVITAPYQVDNLSELRYITIGEGGGNGYANLAIRENGSISYAHSNFVNSSTFGVTIAETANLHGQARLNSFSNNANGAMSVYAHHVGWFDYATDYESRVVVNGGTVADTTAYRNLGVPYYVTGNITVRAPMNPAPGAEFIMAANRGIVVEEGGHLQAVGSPSEYIVFRGEQSTQGYWHGITFLTDHIDNEFRYVRVSDGGGNNFGNLYIAPGASAFVNTCTITNSSRWGIYAAGTPIITQPITYSNNASGDFHQP